MTAKPSGQYLVAGIKELSRLGCFVKTKTFLPVGASVSLRITYDLREFNASGEVIYVLPGRGMGIAFRAIPPVNQSVLEDWLAQSRHSDSN